MNLHNWADSTQIRVVPHREDGSSLHIVYSGNLGLAHDVDTIAAAMLALRDDPHFRFTFIGGGSRRAELTSFLETNNLHAVTMRPYVTLSDLGETLGVGDIGLVTQRDDCCGTVVPSKVYGLMAAGRPILYVGPATATPAQIVQTHACGWRVACGDSQGLVALLLHLQTHPEEVHLAGLHARHALETNYDYSLGTSRLVTLLTGGVKTPLYISTPPANLTCSPVTSTRL